jgi:hypothetical protein
MVACNRWTIREGSKPAAGHPFTASNPSRQTKGPLRPSNRLVGAAQVRPDVDSEFGLRNDSSWACRNLRRTGNAGQLGRVPRGLSPCAPTLDFGQHRLNRGRLDSKLWQARKIRRRNMVVLHQCDLIAR